MEEDNRVKIEPQDLLGTIFGEIAKGRPREKKILEGEELSNYIKDLVGQANSYLHNPVKFQVGNLVEWKEPWKSKGLCNGPMVVLEILEEPYTLGEDGGEIDLDDAFYGERFDLRFGVLSSEDGSLGIYLGSSKLLQLYSEE